MTRYPGINGGSPQSVDDRVKKLEEANDERDGELIAIHSMLTELRDGQKRQSESLALIHRKFDDFMAVDGDRRQRAVERHAEHEGRLRVLEGSARESFESIREITTGSHAAAHNIAKAEELEKDRFMSMRAKADEAVEEVEKLKERLAAKDAAEAERLKRHVEDSRTHWVRFLIATAVTIVITSGGWGIAWILTHR